MSTQIDSAPETARADNPAIDLRELVERLWLAASDLRGFVDHQPYGSIQFHGTGKAVQETESYRLAIEAIREAEMYLHGESVTVPHPLRSTGATGAPS